MNFHLLWINVSYYRNIFIVQGSIHCSLMNHLCRFLCPFMIISFVHFFLLHNCTIYAVLLRPTKQLKINKWKWKQNKSQAIQTGSSLVTKFEEKSLDICLPSAERFAEPVFRIRISFHADPDPGSQKCPYGSGSRPLIFYSDPDPRGVKIK